LRLHDFGLLADENVNPHVVEYLRERGLDVLDVKETLLVGRPDVELIKVALAENRVIVTHDRDFGRLAVASLEPMVGILFLRPGHKDASFTIGMLEAVLSTELEVTPPFILVAVRTQSGISIRVRSF
jgi:predicted nuclease of predicted toxin-antitoxin system